MAVSAYIRPNARAPAASTARRATTRTSTCPLSYNWKRMRCQTTSTQLGCKNCLLVLIGTSWHRMSKKWWQPHNLTLYYKYTHHTHVTERLDLKKKYIPTMHFANGTVFSRGARAAAVPWHGLLRGTFRDVHLNKPRPPGRWGELS